MAMRLATAPTGLGATTLSPNPSVRHNTLSHWHPLVAFLCASHAHIEESLSAVSLVTSPLVHTVFKTEGIGKEFAWWKHK